LGIAFTGSLIYNHGFQPSTQAFDNEVARIGRQMLNTGEGGFILPFEAVSMLLLAAMVGCIVIAMRSEKKENKVENGKAKVENKKILESVQ
jgi:NADH-quinone oxidoreductase subunit J